MKPKRCSTSQLWSQILLVIFGGVIASQNSGKLENQQNQINPSVPQRDFVNFWHRVDINWLVSFDTIGAVFFSLLHLNYNFVSTLIMYQQIM